MSMNARLKRLEDEILRGEGYRQGMAIMEKLNKAQGDSIPDLLIELLENSRKHSNQRNIMY